MNVHIRETNLTFGSLSKRSRTDQIVIHHTGDGANQNYTAKEIHKMHLNLGWSGIGYHFVIQKDGTIDRGRPEETTGAHAEGENNHTIGINVAGDFETGAPANEQLEAVSMLCAALCTKYNIAPDARGIVGHRDLMATACPGKNLYKLLPDIRGKAIWYQQHPPETEEKPKDTEQESGDGYLYKLSAKYESNGDPAAVSSGSGDRGGISYGIYQLSSNAGSVGSFLRFACRYKNEALANYGKVLSEFDVNSNGFIREWKSIGSIDPAGFAELQNAYAKSVYYDEAAQKLRRAHYTIETKSKAMQAVLFSRAIQYGAGNMIELYTEAAMRLGYVNLSYVDDQYFDKEMIASIYDFLIEECDRAYNKGNGTYHSPKDWANGSYTVVKAGLKNRFVNEKADALGMMGSIES